MKDTLEKTEFSQIMASWESGTVQDSQHHNLDGRVVEIQGLRVVGLGGIFRGEIWNPKNLKNPGSQGVAFIFSVK